MNVSQTRDENIAASESGSFPNLRNGGGLRGFGLTVQGGVLQNTPMVGWAGVGHAQVLSQPQGRPVHVGGVESRVGHRPKPWSLLGLADAQAGRPSRGPHNWLVPLSKSVYTTMRHNMKSSIQIGDCMEIPWKLEHSFDEVRCLLIPQYTWKS